MEEQDKYNEIISSESAQHIMTLIDSLSLQNEKLIDQNHNTNVKQIIVKYLKDLEGNFIMDKKHIKEALMKILHIFGLQEKTNQNKSETSNNSRIETIKSKHKEEKKELEEKISIKDKELMDLRENNSFLSLTNNKHYDSIVDLGQKFSNILTQRDEKIQQLENDIELLNNKNEQLKKEINKLKRINDFLRKNMSSNKKMKNNEPQKMERNIISKHFIRAWALISSSSKHSVEPLKTYDDQNNETFENNFEDSQAHCEEQLEDNDHQHQQFKINGYIQKTISSQINDKTLIFNIFSVHSEFFGPIEKFFTEISSIEVNNKEKYFLKIEKEINGLMNHGDIIKLNIDKDKEYKNNEYAALVIYCTGSRVEFSLYTQVIEDLKEMYNKRMVIFKLVGGNDSNPFLIPGDHLQVVLKASISKEIYYNDDNIETIKSLCKSIDNKKL